MIYAKHRIKIIVCFSLIIAGISIQGCKCKEKASVTVDTAIVIEKFQAEETAGTKTLPHALVYKTKKDYSKNVPVSLNEDKTAIVSYPAPTDIFFNGSFAYPTPLENGYLLDNRGIGQNVAFLEYTYQEYSELKQVPEKNMLFKKIIDFNPLMELWDCGIRKQSKTEIEIYNTLIKNKFPDCRQMINIDKVNFEP